MITPHFDAIILGTGPAGPGLADRLSRAGRRSPLIECKFFGDTASTRALLPPKHGLPAPMPRISRVGHAVEKGETESFTKVLVSADSRAILGAAIRKGTRDEVIHSPSDAMYTQAPYTVASQALHSHPTVSELIPNILG